MRRDGYGFAVPGARIEGRHRRRTSSVAAALIAAAVLALGSAGPAGGENTAAAHSQPVAVIYTTQATLTQALRRHPALLIRDLTQIHTAEVRPLGPIGGFIAAMRRAPGVRDVRTPVERESDATPPTASATPTAGALEWQYFATGVDKVPTGVLTAARGITIGVVDTGADTASLGVTGRVAGVCDIRNGKLAAGDENGHGTFVTSLLTGSSTSAATMPGFAGQARVLVVKVSASSVFNDLDVAAGILYAVNHGARIVNLSVAGRIPSPVEASAIRYAAAHGALVVAAAGNDALIGNPPEYPAAYLQPIGSNGSGGLGLSVAASDSGGAAARFSESGSFISLAAPGAGVFGAIAPLSSPSAFPRSTTAIGGLFGYATGTSFAAPQVAGAAALVWAANPALKPTAVTDILKQTASGHGVWTPALGFGVINVAAAVDRAANSSH
jgi:subtilisin family serine protease